MIDFLRSLFDCSHQRMTLPLTPRRGSARKGTYVVCLSCGAEFNYNWDRMEIGERIAAPRPQRFNDGLETKA